MENCNGGQASNKVPFTGTSTDTSQTRSNTSNSNRSSASSNHSSLDHNNRKLFDDNAFKNIGRKLLAVAKNVNDPVDDPAIIQRRMLETYSDELKKLQQMYDRKRNLRH